MESIKKKKGGKKKYGSSKTASAPTGKKGIEKKVNKLSRQLNTLAKNAAPEWLTVRLVQSDNYSSYPDNTYWQVNQDSGTGRYLGPNVQGSADGQIRSDSMQYKFLELALHFKIGLLADDGIVGQSAGSLLPTADGSIPGGIDYFYGNRIRCMVVFNNSNSATGNGTTPVGPHLGTMLQYSAMVPTAGDAFYNLVEAYYDEDTGGKRKDHWVLYDEVLDMTKLGTINDNLSSETTAPILGGEYTHRVKLDLKDTPRAKVIDFVTLGGGLLGPDIFDHGMLSLHVFSNKAGPTTSPTRGALVPVTWCCSATGRLVYTCP